ncbi:speedy protein E4A-like [Pyxicephalus adspersus]|uniref:speedy protein E4A-like n=1 Tax=Pyxicephalus adspersus TaxID=30357 RepID=UPI003B593A33
MLNFFAALFLANEMEEKDQSYFYLYLTVKPFINIPTFKILTREFFMRIKMKVWVTEKECQQVMEGQDYKVWRREHKYQPR